MSSHRCTQHPQSDDAAPCLLERLEAELVGVTPAPCDFQEPGAPVFLTGVSTPDTRVAGLDNLGLLAQPGNSLHLDADRYLYWAADNGCFAEAMGRPWDADEWLSWVVSEVVPRRSNLLFATAPDVVGDARATLDRSARYLAVLQKLGLPAALVAQNGFEDLTGLDWDSFDCLFIGGSPECRACRYVRPLADRRRDCPRCGARLVEWKESPAAAAASAEARARGKWVHVGRVNSWRRLALVRAHHADSADGTYLAFGPKVNWPKLLAWLERLRADAGPYTCVRRAPRQSDTVPARWFLYGARTLEEGVAAYELACAVGELAALGIDETPSDVSDGGRSAGREEAA